MEFILGDCLEELEKLDNDSVSLFVLDLPFGCTQKKWDIKIDLQKLWRLIKLKIKREGVCLFFGTAKFGYKLIESNPEWFAYDLIWQKSRPTGFLNAKVAPLRIHETIYVFKNSSGVYNPKMIKREKPLVQKRKKKMRDGLYNQYSELEEVTYTHKYPNSILEFASVHKPIHSTQKPVPLLEYLILTYSNETDLVVDPCAGSFSTAVACQNTWRQFVGIEMDKDIYEKAKEFLSKNKIGM